MKQILPVLLFAMFYANISHAQKNNLHIGIGYQRTWLVDKQASPLKYQTSEKSFLLDYLHSGNKSMFNVNLAGSFGDFFPTGFRNRQLYNPGYNADGSPKKDSFPFVGTLYNAKFKVAYLRNISNGFSTIGKEKLYSHNYAGASINNQLFYTDNFVRTCWLNTSSVDAEYYHAALLQNKHSFNIGISVPLFARNARLPYHNTISSPNDESNFKTFFKQGSRFVSIINFQNIQLHAAYEYAVNKHFGLGLQYAGQWLHYKYEQPVTLFQNNISLVGSFK